MILTPWQNFMSCLYSQNPQIKLYAEEYILDVPHVTTNNISVYY